MIVKVCGLRDEQNIQDICQLEIQWIGLNFYKPSSRYIAKYEKESISQIPDHIKRVGVFVNEDIDTIQKIVKQFQLDYVQLHGDESVSFCESIKKVIKVFRIDKDFKMSITKDYESAVDYFLFDTNSKHFGGSGKKFNWDILSEYTGSTPFLLSGGIGPEDTIDLIKLKHPQYVGIDINSKFEIAPAVKSKALIETFLTKLNIETSEISS